MDYTKYLENYPEYKDKISVFMDKIARTKKTWEESFTDFLNPDEQMLLKRICRDEEVHTGFMGGVGYFERAVAVISCVQYSGSFPIDIIKIKGNLKFEKLNHRDYLGSLLALGIRREKVGDINVFDDGAEIWLSSDISDYICYNLNKIKHTGIKCEKISFSEAKEKIQSFKEISANISSMRLDCVVSALTKLSRGEAVSLIKSGYIKVNYNVEKEFSKKVNEGDLLSIKGHGRYLIDGIINITKSQRINIALRKFI